MAFTTDVFLLSGVIFVLVIINAFLIRRAYETSKKLDTLLEGGKIKSFKEVFLRQKERNSDLEGMIKEAFSKIKDLEEISKITIQKTGIVRFNPFNEMGGNQSFAVAILDSDNNGFVISSLFVKEGNRVYAKAIKDGRSDHPLSDEEKQAIIKAINGN